MTYINAPRLRNLMALMALAEDHCPSFLLERDGQRGGWTLSAEDSELSPGWWKTAASQYDDTTIWSV